MTLTKKACEICGLADLSIIHRHHIIPQSDPRCTNSHDNLACLCPNCHSKVHTGELIIIGVYPSTDGRCLVWFKSNEEPPFPKELWLVKENPLVRTLPGDSDDIDLQKLSITRH